MIAARVALLKLSPCWAVAMAAPAATERQGFSDHANDKLFENFPARSLRSVSGADVPGMKQMLCAYDEIELPKSSSIKSHLQAGKSTAGNCRRCRAYTINEEAAIPFIWTDTIE